MGVLADTCGRRGASLLLLLELLVASVSADCVRPVLPNEMMLSDETLLTSSFPEGASVTLACELGHNRTSGSGLLTCTGGEWSQPDLVCTKKDCGAPPDQPNVIYDLSGGTKLGDIIKVTCKEGYQISGSNYKQCFINGWLGRSRCKVKDCRSPKLPANMTVSIPNGTLYGAEVEVFCNSGYRLIGSRIRRCENNGWSGDPQCDPVTCDIIRVLANGRSSWDSDSDSLTAGQTINFACDEGHVLAGASSIVCQEDGTYDNQPPTCLSVTTKGRFEANRMTSMTSMTSTSMTPTPGLEGTSEHTVTQTLQVTEASKSTDRPVATSAEPDALASTSGGRSTTSTMNKALAETVHVLTTVPAVVMTNTFIDRQGHIALIAALASVAFVVGIVGCATRNIFSKRTGSSEVPRLISDASAAQEEGASQL